MAFRRSFLKWPGGKYHWLEKAQRHIPVEGELWVEPFAGALNLFLNFPGYERYRLNDTNPDLINLYRTIQTDFDGFMAEVDSLWSATPNEADAYYALRDEFNAREADSRRHAALFLRLLRSSYNGLVRYNRKGGFNAPAGSYKAIRLPEKELRGFHAYLDEREVRFYCGDFAEMFEGIDSKASVVADPPYVPLTPSASFTAYQATGFSLDQQEQLAALLARAARQGSHCFAFNHDVALSRELYREADELVAHAIPRAISRNGKGRQSAPELLACYTPRG